MKITHLNRVVVLTTLLLAVFLSAACGALDILGPRDKLDFMKKDLNAVTIAYGSNTRATNGLKRTFTVTNRLIIDGLRSNMNISKIQGLSVGTRDQLRLEERGGRSWHGSIVSKTRIDLSSTEDGWRSYAIEFADERLVDNLLELCVHNERTFHPKAKPENIMLLQEFLVEEYPGASPESVQVRKDMLNAYPQIEE